MKYVTLNFFFFFDKNKKPKLYYKKIEKRLQDNI